MDVANLAPVRAAKLAGAFHSGGPNITAVLVLRAVGSGIAAPYAVTPTKGGVPEAGDLWWSVT